LGPGESTSRHSPPDSLLDESLKVKPSQEKQPMVALESECGESSESKTRPLKFSGSGPAQENRRGNVSWTH